MMKRTGVTKTLLASKGDHWLQAAILAVYTIFGGLAPVWIISLKYSTLTMKPLSLEVFAGHGEFAIYAAAIIAPALYTLGRDTGTHAIPKRDLLLLVSFISWGLAIVAFAQFDATVLNYAMQTQSHVYSQLTLFLFLVCLLLFFLVAVLDNIRGAPPVEAMADDDYSAFASKFETMRGRNEQ